MRIFLLSFAFLLLCAYKASAQYIEQKPLITVIGTGVENIVPDEIIITYTVTEALNSQNLSALRSITQGSLDVDMKFFGLSEQNILRSIDIITGTKANYSLVKEFVITLHSLSRYYDVLENLIKLNKGEIMLVELRSTQLDKLTEKARQEAILQAQSKAEKMAELLGVKLGKPYTVKELPVIISNWYKRTGDKNTVDNSIGDVYKTYPGTISIIAEVSVGYEILR